MIESTADAWWKNAIVYSLDIETFYDADGDGVGDVDGFMRTVDYLAGLGVTCIWLMPFYPTPNRDDGYDVCDHIAVDERLGTLGDMVEAVRVAGDRGIRVIADLVVNHTSDQHWWFKESRSSRDSPYRNYYVWTDDPHDHIFDQVIFPDAEESNWSFDEEAGQYYLHRFYSHQPDLNIADPRVREEIGEVVGFWAQQGMSGFRVDAVPYLIETKGIEADIQADPHTLLRNMRRRLGRRRGDAMMMGEVNLEPKRQVEYFGGGQELDLIFNFEVNQRMWLAFARQSAEPIAEALRALPEVPPDCGWANFLRVHDEVNVGRLSESERQEVFAAFGPEESMQVHGRGLRRRLAPIFSGDEQRMRMAYSLLFALPGTPVLYYGEEIGMGENLDIPGRNAVRTPMQWTPETNAGFTLDDVEPVRAPPQGAYGPSHVNVRDMRDDPASLLTWMTSMIRRRRETPEVGWGTTDVIETDVPEVLVLHSRWGDRRVLTAHNLSGRPITARTSEILGGGAPEVLFSDRCTRVEGAQEALHLEMVPYGFVWARIRTPGDRRPY